MTTIEDLSYYLQAGPFTDLSGYQALVEPLPGDVPALVRVVQGLVLHIFWADRYGQSLTTGRKLEVNLRSVQAKMAAILQKDDAPLATSRELPRRLIGNCRDFTLMLVAMLRSKGFPARARCGFGTYFEKGKYIDHWVAEYWHAGDNRWVMVDAQIDAFQTSQLGITFDPLDMPEGHFLPAGAAWQLCRKGKAEPLKFGIQRWWGMEFILGDLQRDLLALNRIELLPWDVWGMIGKPFGRLPAGRKALLDQVALFTCTPDTPLSLIRSLYEANPVFHPPADLLK